MRNSSRRLLLIALAVLLVSPAAFAYYHFIHFTSPYAPYEPVRERFDLNALVDGTLRYYVDQSGPETLATGDSFPALVSQIRLAAETWNSVETSELRLAFGGVGSLELPQTTAAVDILFDEMSPGVIAMGGPTSRAEMVTGVEGSFVPIVRSVVILNKDLSSQPSWSENFFLTMAHEMGHALGLQHTLTSSLMSTRTTRATTKARPLAADDAAAISLLYPNPKFETTMGAVSGRVTVDGAGVNLASVVVLSPGGVSVSTLTNPDGTYRVEGIPPGSYYVYVHPLPPPVFGQVSPADIVMPLDPEGNPMVAGAFFDTVFFPGVKNVQVAAPVRVAAGATTEGVDFLTGGREKVDLYAVSTYSFPGNVAVRPGFVSFYPDRWFLVASGFGLVSGESPTPGLRASVIGGSAFVGADGLKPYPPDPRFLRIDFSLNVFSGSGARHLLFALNDEIYILPAGLNITFNEPPTIDGIAAGFDPDGRSAVAVVGQRLGAKTRILFDGQPADVTAIDEAGVVYLTPPPAPSSHNAKVVALNGDGQSSLFLAGNNPPEWTYEAAETPSFTVLPRSIPAGTEAMVEIRGVDTHFVPDMTVLGIGSSDVTVRGIWVTGPDRLIANVFVSPEAGTPIVPVTVMTGMELLTQQNAFELQPAAPAWVTVYGPAFNPETGAPQAVAGGLGAIHFSQLGETSVTGLTLNDQPMEVVSAADNLVVFRVPTDFPLGAAVLRLTTTLGQTQPVVIEVGAAPATLVAVYGQNGDQINGGRAAVPGELLTILVTGMGEPDDEAEGYEVQVSVGTIKHKIRDVLPLEGNPDVYLVRFFLGTTVPEAESVLIHLTVDGRISGPVPIAVAPSS